MNELAWPVVALVAIALTYRATSLWVLAVKQAQAIRAHVDCELDKHEKDFLEVAKDLRERIAALEFKVN